MAGRIPQSFIDELLTRTDIVDVIDSRVQLKKAGREYKACCPFHNEKTPSFTVSQVKQFYHCFGCGAHGTAISFLMDYEHMGFVEAVEELAHMAGLEVPPVLLSGDHQAIEDWRRREALRATLRKRPDLLAAASLGDRRLGELAEVAAEEGIGAEELSRLVRPDSAEDNEQKGAPHVGG